jgi:5,6-dimethylbenzimidazole synthase
MTDPAHLPADTVDTLDRLLRWRRDVRHFRRDPIPEPLVAALLDTAMLAPSVGNAQPWRFVRIETPALRARLAEHVDGCNRAAAARYADDPARCRAYAALKLHGLREAPLVIAAFSDDAPVAGHGLGIATMPEMLRYSTVLAIHTLWLAARARGIGMGWVSILDPPALRALLDVPSRWAPVGLLCLGHPLDPADTPELERRGWQPREPLADRLFTR